jgi:hypothetical protein
VAVLASCSYRSISYTGVPPMKRYDIACLHTIVGNDPAPAAHISIGSKGERTQTRDTHFQSAANYEGNHRVIAIETEDIGPDFAAWNTNDGRAVPAWTAAQCESIAVVLAELHHLHGIPLTLAPDSRPTSRGIGYHRQGVDGNWAGYAYSGRVSGGEVWTKSRGKVCPGDRRIKQLIEIVIPRARALAAGEQEIDMATLNEVAAGVWDLQQRVTSMHSHGFLAVPGIPNAPGGDLSWVQDQLNSNTTLEGLAEDSAAIREALGIGGDGAPVAGPAPIVDLSDDQLARVLTRPEVVSTFARAFADEQSRRLAE